jgi:tRNA(Ile)-lysidine synthase
VTEFASRVAEALATQRLLLDGERAAVGVSGGLDSVVLLHLLHQLAPQHGWSLVVLHFNHQLRGRRSDADEKFVRRLARSLRLPCRVGRSNVRRFARQKKISIEMAARELRHRFFARAATAFGTSKVVLAHHTDDQIELFFLRLMRGLGPHALGGMRAMAPSPADARVQLVRPLLDVPRADIEAFATEARLIHREDASNADVSFERNRIRHELLPLLKANFQSNLNRTVARVMEVLRAEGEFVAEQASRARAQNTVRFAELPLALQRQWIIQECQELGIAPSFDWVERLRSEEGVDWMIRPGTLVWRDKDGRVHSRRLASAEFRAEEQTIRLEKANGQTVFDGVLIRWWRRACGGRDSIDRKAHQEVFDVDKVGAELRLRHWRAGDRFQPIGMDQRVKLQDLFTNQRVSALWRRQAVVAERADGTILWVEGLRISERVKVDQATTSCLHWSWVRAANATAFSNDAQLAEGAD